jgi:Flp pilus assembly protein TadB
MPRLNHDPDPRAQTVDELVAEMRAALAESRRRHNLLEAFANDADLMLRAMHAGTVTPERTLACLMDSAAEVRAAMVPN